MSAGLGIGDTVIWGSNGAFETLIGVMQSEAAKRLGNDAPLTVFLANESDTFFIGKVVLFDDWVKDAKSRQKFLEILSAGIEQLRTQGTFNDCGKDWLSQILTELRAMLSQLDLT